MRSLLLACLLAALSVGTVACGPGTDGPGDVGELDGGSDGGTNDGDGGDTDGGDEEPDVCARAFDYAPGFPCNFDSDCKTGACVSDGVRSLCADPCGEGDACAGGFACSTAAGQDGAFCFPEPGAAIPFEDGALEPGSPCFSDMDCANDAFCTNLGGVWLCAPTCLAAEECGECSTCRFDLPSPAGGGFLCTPQGQGKIGRKCASNYECQSFDCQGFCTQQCTFGECPEGAECEYPGGGYSLCIDPAQRGRTQPGDSCWYDFECVSGSKCQPSAAGGSVCGVPRGVDEACELHEECAEGLRCIPNALRTARSCQHPGGPGAGCFENEDCASGNSCRDFALNHGVCTKDCSESSDCGPGGTCVGAEVDTLIELWDPVDTEWPYLENDDFDYSRGLHWSRVEFEPIESGTFHVAVRTHANVGGPYRLSLIPLISEDEPVVVEEEEGGGGNDTVDSAQKLDTLPVIVEGELEHAADRDFFEFQVSELGRIIIETSRGRPSACLASDLVESAAMGESCTFHHQCADGLCDRGLGDEELGVCSADCTDDITSCPSGFACMDVETGRACVATERLRTKARGDECRFTFECQDGSAQASGICVKPFGETPFCSARCETIACADGWSCETVQARQVGVGTLLAQACVP